MDWLVAAQGMNMVNVLVNVSLSLMLSHSSQSFVVIAVQTYCQGQIGFKYGIKYGPSACCILANFFHKTNHIKAFSDVHYATSDSISAILIKTLAHGTLSMLPNWLLHMQAGTKSLGLPHTSRQGPDLALLGRYLLPNKS